jgi:N-acetylmuramoyl-L-alanine amidase
VTIPEKQRKQEPRATEQRHRFLRRGEPSRLILIVKRAGKPRANESYVLEIKGQPRRGVTDPQGRLEQPIPGDATSGTLTVGEGDVASSYTLQLGNLDPKDTASGVQARLNNLGFECGAATGVWTDKLRQAVLKFQNAHKLPPTGNADQLTQQKLKEVHGS